MPLQASPLNTACAVVATSVAHVGPGVAATGGQRAGVGEVAENEVAAVKQAAAAKGQQAVAGVSGQNFKLGILT